jgi:hypothetical protein
VDVEIKPVVLVSGVSSGTGRSVTAAFVDNRFRVFGTARQPDRTDPIPGVEMLELDVHISSILGVIPQPYMAFHSATKHAVEGYSESLDHELRRRRVREPVDETQCGADDPAVVARAALTAATAPKPAVRYTAGKTAQRVSLLRRFVPAARVR